jgi:hypothetical protein
MSTLSRRTILRATGASAVIMAPAAALGAVINDGNADPVVKLVADFYEAERVAKVSEDAEEAARQALPDMVRDPRIIVTFAGDHTVVRCRTAEQVDFAYRRGALFHSLSDEGQTPELRAATKLIREVQDRLHAEETENYFRLSDQHRLEVQKEFDVASKRAQAKLEEAKELAAAEKERLGQTALHERTEEAYARIFELQKQVFVTSATTLVGLAARLRVLASISTAGSIPDEDFVVSIADDAARLAGGAALAAPSFTSPSESIGSMSTS